MHFFTSLFIGLCLVCAIVLWNQVWNQRTNVCLPRLRSCVRPSTVVFSLHSVEQNSMATRSGMRGAQQCTPNTEQGRDQRGLEQRLARVQEEPEVVARVPRAHTRARACRSDRTAGALPRKAGRRSLKRRPQPGRRVYLAAYLCAVTADWLQVIIHAHARVMPHPHTHTPMCERGQHARRARG